MPDPTTTQQFAWSILGLLSIFALIFAVIPTTLAFFFRPRKGNPTKEMNYECGLYPKTNPWVQFNIQYYLFALAFVIFSIEILYVYPWAINFKKLGGTAVLEMFAFLFILGIGLVYAWKKGGLEWN